ncbi:mechanosensitive ion channel family protein [Bacteroidia bacterium]|nr:mechanosensitive ion channel family protein [Bacteroidia bacterium]MDC1395268.1 mechanosensitive ion channel family protein [Bacteroidia bacterium]
MNIDIRQWLGANLGINHAVSTIILIGIALLSVLFIWWLSKKLLSAFIPRFTAKTVNVWDDIIFNKRIIKSLATLIPALVLYHFLPVLFKDSTRILPFILSATDVIIVLVSVWIFSSFFTSINEILSNKDRYKDKPIGSLTQLAKILTYSIGAILIISSVISRSPIYLLSGLGAIAAVLLLVFKDSILGFVASIQLSANNMVQVGDWVTVPNYGADGDVLEINLTTIKVQNFDLTITTIPTYVFISDSFTNWRGMQNSNGRRIKRSINIKKDTIRFCDETMLNRFKKMELISDYIIQRKEEIKNYNAEHNVDTSTLVNGRNMTNIGVLKVYIEKYLNSNPNINSEMMIMVRQLPSAEIGLPLEVYAFSKNKDWKVYESVMSDIFDHILSVVPYFDLQLFESPAGSDFRNLVKKSQ